MAARLKWGASRYPVTDASEDELRAGLCESKRDMTVEQRDVIDFAGADRLGNFVLTISDHLQWDNVNKHLFFLQEKINAYLRFTESGEIYRKFPEAKGLPVIISVALKFGFPEEANWFFSKASNALEAAGFKFEANQISN
jgi:hypothetical protein